MKLFGTHAPGEQQDGYLPGAWDEVRSAYLDGHVSEEAYDVLQQVMHQLHGGNAADGVQRYKVTIRGDGTEIRGHATMAALAALADDTSDPFVVVASPVAKGDCLHHEVTGLCVTCGQVPVEGVR